MKLTRFFAQNLLFILWNMVAFLCSIISFNTFCVGQKPSFFVSKYIFNYFYILYNKFKNLIYKKILKNKANSTAKTLVAANSIYKNKNFVSNRVNLNNIRINQAFKYINSLYINRLKDVLATQNLISHLKQHFTPLGAMIVVDQAMLIQLNLSCINACSDNIKKVMTITQDKCAFLYPFISKNYHCLNSF